MLRQKQDAAKALDNPKLTIYKKSVNLHANIKIYHQIQKIQSKLISNMMMEKLNKTKMMIKSLFH